MTVDPLGEEYVYVQLANILRARIADGTYPPGRALPAALTLSQTYGISIGSVKRATGLLKEDGLVHFVKGRGLFVSRKS